MSTSKFQVSIGLFAAIAFGSPLVPAPLHAAPPVTVAGVSIYTPAPGSPERTEMMNSLRTAYQEKYHDVPEKIVFTVNRLRAGNGYAFMEAFGVNTLDDQPAYGLSGGGGSLNALFHKQNGHWKVVDWGSFIDDTLIPKWKRDYPKAPAAIFPGSKAAVRAGSKIDTYTPKPGSPERTELMEVLRGPFAQKYHKTVTFQVYALNVSLHYAYLSGLALGTDGKPALGPDKNASKIDALYRKQNGHWTVLKWGLGGGAEIETYGKEHYPNAPAVIYP